MSELLPAEDVAQVLRDALKEFGKHTRECELTMDSGYLCVCGLDEALEYGATAETEGKHWRCFHCDEVFTDIERAAEHFGKHEMLAPACTIDIAEYRRMEEVNRRHCEEDTELHRALYAKEANHQVALRREEEKGYERGLEDAKKHPETLGLRRADETPAPHILTWRERCQIHPDHEGIVSEAMIHQRMQEEIDELRAVFEPER